jgi:very-short-patch-repair endonuclease
MNYQGSKRHIENALKTRQLALLASAVKKQSRMELYYANPKKCRECGGAIAYEWKLENIFCSRSCAAKFNTKNRNCSHSEKTKRAIRKGVNDYYLRTAEMPPAENSERTTTERKSSKRTTKGHALTCRGCQITFYHKRKKTVTCSQACLVRVKAEISEKNRETASVRGRINMEIMMREGRWKGWSGQGEGRQSFPEQYIESLLVKDGLTGYTSQYQEGPYKIDFAFPKQMLALEVDGKQHRYPNQAQSDQRKDELLMNAGWIVFRLSWHSVKTSSGLSEVIGQYNRFKQLLFRLK